MSLFEISTWPNKMNCELMLTYDTPAYMFNVYKNQLSRQTGSRNLTGPKTLSTIWHTNMKLVTKYQISAINSCWEKCAEKYLGTDGRTEVKQSPVKRRYNYYLQFYLARNWLISLMTSINIFGIKTEIDKKRCLIHYKEMWTILC
jgi:hypothetical protein